MMVGEKGRGGFQHFNILNDFLLGLAENRARALMVEAQPGVQVSLGSWVSSIDQESLQSYERTGFQEVRRN